MIRDDDFIIDDYVTYETKVLLFDMDGTLVDSTPVVERTWRNFAKRHALDSNEILKTSHGRRTADTVQFWAPANIDINKETARVVAQEIADIEGITAVAGAKDLLHLLRDYPNRWAVVTSASRELAMRRMKAAELPIPNILITSEDVQKGKPAPDGYLTAAKALQAIPEECLVFEDAPAGIQSANNAGMRVFAVGPHSKTTQLTHAQWILNFKNLQLSIPNSEKDVMRLTLTGIRKEKEIMYEIKSKF